MSFKVCSYNMGCGLADYVGLCDGSNMRSWRDLPAQQQDTEYLTIQTTVAQALKESADVFCLQEVTDLSRPLPAALTTLNFSLHYMQARNPNCVVAINTDVFTDIEDNLSAMTTSGDGDYALVVATHKVSRQRMAFASLHVPGCSLEHTITDEEAQFGDRYCKEVLKRLKIIENTSLQVIGADVNANPQKWNKRFERFKKKKFKVLSTGIPTNVNPKSENYSLRELDFLFYNSSRWSICHEVMEIVDPSECSVKLHPSSNSSDHIPIFSIVRP